jgi:signal transduction histidine kinase
LEAEALRETLDQLRLEVAELRASRRRLVLAADADRRRMERDLHDGPQQRLVALAVNLQLLARLAHADSAAVKALLEQMAAQVRQAQSEAARLAQRIYPPLLEAGGLAAALRTGAADLGVPTRISVPAVAGYPPEVASTVYFCGLEVLERAGKEARASVTVGHEEGALVFEVVAEGVVPGSDAGLEPLRDRVEAIEGQLTVHFEARDGIRVSGSLPLRDDVSRSRPGRGPRP